MNPLLAASDARRVERVAQWVARRLADRPQTIDEIRGFVARAVTSHTMGCGVYVTPGQYDAIAARAMAIHEGEE